MGHPHFLGCLGVFFVAAVPGPVGFDFYSALFAGEPVLIAAPWPVLRSFDEFPLYGIAMEVAKLLTELALGEDAEVVVAALPELDSVAFEVL
jgi:hypothetical protein